METKIRIQTSLNYGVGRFKIREGNILRLKVRLGRNKVRKHCLDKLVIKTITQVKIFCLFSRRTCVSLLDKTI